MPLPYVSGPVEAWVTLFRHMRQHRTVVLPATKIRDMRFRCGCETIVDTTGPELRRCGTANQILGTCVWLHTPRRAGGQ